MDEHTQEPCAVVSGILIHPDRGLVEGFFVHTPAFFGSEMLFLQTMDIRHWGTHIRIESSDLLIPTEDVIRLAELLQENRPVLGQRMISEEGRTLGTCRDVQFDTQHFQIEWLFPKQWMRWQPAIPASSIVEVRTDVIVVRHATLLPEKPESGSLLPAWGAA